ncbi:acetoin utilization protein AcuC [Nakamurella antarctica]|uniref:Acetoin utilization protein AcuC n=1 Tax=Nakamurella antarctica TaxID=1902245 RepID=A0A3G8ZKE8_9ACTN|nr:acetoin utilization protein AcuC [Nakamurella antarctica]AZI57680.1 acetoin utilization protein AcuC [Nakamurella antarctica]
MGTPLVVWDRKLLAYNLGAEHPLHPLRWELTMSLADQLGVLEGIELLTPTQADDETLGTVHSAAYIAAVKASSVAGARPQGIHGLGTPDNPIFEHMHSAASLIAGGSVQAARAIARREVDRAANIAGGLHHAMADSASGFCVYNDAALAIKELLAQGVTRVAYVDVDVHHGDGVQAAFYDDPRVLTVSIHQSPLALWPGTGWPSELGRGAAAGTSVNITVPAGTGDSGWLRAFHAVVPAVVQAFRPEVLVTQSGADSHAEDPLADLKLSVDGQLASYLALRDLAENAAGGRWLALGGGGYALARVVPRAWAHLLAVLADKDVAPSTELPQAYQTEAAQYDPFGGDPARPMPTTMSDSDGRPAEYTPWHGEHESSVDRGIAQARAAIFPLHGLDPFDARD